jgi:hypothetical protein
MDDAVLLFYAHTEYMDIILPSLRSINKYFSGVKMALCINDATELLEKYSDEFKFKYVHEYKPGEHVYARIEPLLKKIEEPYIIFHLEINILADYVDKDVMETIIKTMKLKDIDQVKLFVTGVITPPEVKEELIRAKEKKVVVYEVLRGYYLGLNTTLWKRTSFLELASNFRDHSWRCSECYDIQEYCRLHFKNYSHATRDDRVIIFDVWEHNYSAAYPAVHVTSAAKWRLTGKYQTELVKKIWDEWGMNPDTREKDQTENHIF